jgi:hypothetical protein
VIDGVLGVKKLVSGLGFYPDGQRAGKRILGESIAYALELLVQQGRHFLPSAS